MKLSPRQSSSHIPPVRLCSAIPHLTPPPSTSTHTQTSQTLVPINTHICQYAQIHTFTEEKSQQSVQQSIHIQISRYSCANRPYLKAQVPNLILGPKVLVAIHICRISCRPLNIPSLPHSIALPPLALPWNYSFQIAQAPTQPLSTEHTVFSTSSTNTNP